MRHASSMSLDLPDRVRHLVADGEARRVRLAGFEHPLERRCRPTYDLPHVRAKQVELDRRSLTPPDQVIDDLDACHGEIKAAVHLLAAERRSEHLARNGLILDGFS